VISTKRPAYARSFTFGVAGCNAYSEASVFPAGVVFRRNFDALFASPVAAPALAVAERQPVILISSAAAGAWVGTPCGAAMFGGAVD
jgi:hypothetical protein